MPALRKKIVALSAAVLCMVGSFCCKNAPPKKPFEGCKMGVPKPLFELGMAHVTSQTFVLTDTISIEKVGFDNANTLQFTQTGCEVVQQELVFRVLGNYQDATEKACIMLAINQLYFIGKLSPQLFGFTAWAQAMQEKISELHLGQSYELDKGFRVKISKSATQSEGVFVVTLSE